MAKVKSFLSVTEYQAKKVSKLFKKKGLRLVVDLSTIQWKALIERSRGLNKDIL